MTPTELYEVVKDVPREAWPVSDNEEWKLIWHEGEYATAFWWQSINGQTLSSTEMNPTLIFEASMTRWLLKKNKSLSLWDMPNLTESLAAACKVVKLAHDV